MRRTDYYDILVIGGGHAGAEAAWAAANMGARTALLTMDPGRIGQMSCNPAIGGLAKGQMVREIDALGGLMGLAIDATGIQFRVLNGSKGPAVRGPRAQADKYAYAAEAQRLLATRRNLTILAGTVEEFLVEGGRVKGVVYMPNPSFHTAAWRERRESEAWGDSCCTGEYFSGPDGEDPIIAPTRLNAKAVVLTTGTFMRGLMHTGEAKTPGGRVDEGSAEGISGALRGMGFELGRLKTGTPPRLAAETLDFGAFEEQPGDEHPLPFSDLSDVAGYVAEPLSAGRRSGEPQPGAAGPHEPRDLYPTVARFPLLEQRPCWITHTNEAIHDLIRANLHRAPMYNGQIDPGSTGPRYCPSIEDKVVRFADKHSHHVFLEPESLNTNEIYCNGISTSLPADVQEKIVHKLPGCERAAILRYGYAVEYDMVWPHQIDATCLTKRVAGLFLAGQINGTTGYEEAAGQGLIAGINAVRFACGEGAVRLGRDEAYIGVLMDDLVTKVPREPYRMFTSRAEHRLLLRADNAAERLTPLGRELGVVDDARWAVYRARREAIEALAEYCRARVVEGGGDGRRVTLHDWLRRPESDEFGLLEGIGHERPGGSEYAHPDKHAHAEPRACHPRRAWHPDLPGMARDRRVAAALLSEVKYAGFIERHRRQHERVAKLESRELRSDLDYGSVHGLRNEAKQTLGKFRPATLGQAGRLAGITPADLTVLAMAVGRE